MLTKYFDTAMARATYQKLGDGTWFGEIPGFDGLWANEDTVEGCQEDLRSALEDWLLIALRQNVPLPVVDGIDLNVRNVA
jgi:predicted RNase H-like HicB family nuclease